LLGGLLSSHWGLVSVFWLCVPMALLALLMAWGVARSDR
jgi:predicted MFS family arabinose efflux permease